MSDDKIVNLHSHDDSELEALYQQAEQPMPPADIDAALKRAAREPRAGQKMQVYPWFAGVAISILVAVVFFQLYPGSIPRQTDSVSDLPAKVERRAAEEKKLHDASPSASAPAILDSLQKKPSTQTEIRERESLDQPKDAKLAQPRPEAKTSPLPAAGGTPPAAAGFERMEMQFMSSSPDSGAANGEQKNSATEAGAVNGLAQADDAKARLEHIVELLDQGKAEAARKDWQAFKQRYPDYPVEPELASRLNKLL